MSNKTRKYAWPVSAAMAFALVAALAAFIVLASTPDAAIAHNPGTDHTTDCTPDGTVPGPAAIHDALAGTSTNDDGTQHNCANPGTDVTEPVDDDDDEGMPQMHGGTTAGDPPVSVKSTSASGSDDITINIAELGIDMPPGSSVVLYLRDEFSVPDSIPASSIYFVVKDANGDGTPQTGNGSRVRNLDTVKIKSDTYFSDDTVNDRAIQIFIPDMCPDSTDGCQSADGPMEGYSLTVVVEGSSGIKNPSEAGSYDVGSAVLGTLDALPGSPQFSNKDTVLAKITLSDLDNKRGYELSVTGSGFNDKTTASVYVLTHAVAVWWDTLDCAEMNAAVDSSSTMGSGFCQMWHDLDTDADRKTVYDAAFDNPANEKGLCETITDKGTDAGSATVGSDDKVTVTIEITAPTFQPGNVNYLCMIDGESRRSETDVEKFNLQASIKVVPSTANSR